MPVSLNPNVLCALPKHSPPMTSDKVVRSLTLLEQRFDTMAKVLDPKSATKLLTRLLLGLSTDSKEMYTTIGMPYPGDAIPTEKNNIVRISHLKLSHPTISCSSVQTWSGNY